MTARWFVRPAPRADAPVRLFCLPFAGVGPSAYRGWAQGFGPDVETVIVHLPGREGRLDEQPLTSIPSIVTHLADGLPAMLDRPFGVFGHSLGGLIAFEVVRELRRRGGPTPLALFVSASRAAHLRYPHTALHTLPDRELLQQVNERYDNSVPAMVLESPELQALFLPALRADLAALETYAFAAGEPLECPLSAFAGRHDRTVGAEAIEAWGTHTRGAFRMRMLDEGHLYLQTAREAVIAGVLADLTACGGMQAMAGKRA